MRIIKRRDVFANADSRKVTGFLYASNES